MDAKIQSPLDAARRVIALYYRQTFDEQAIHGTVYQNGQGFNATDAAFGTSVAKQILSGRPITGKQYRVLQKLLPKYHNQLADADLEAIEIPDRVLTILDNWAKDAEERSEPSGPGKVEITPDGQLEFIPNIYPTNQLKGQGFRRGTRKYWTWVTPFSLGQLNLILRFWPEVEITASVQKAIADAKALDEVPEEVEEHETLFPYQKEAIQFMRSHPRALLALAPGLGKTACSIYAAHTSPSAERILIVAPKTLLENWRREINRWVGEPAIIWHRRRPLGESDYRWVVTNYDTIRRFPGEFTASGFDTMIVDESIMAKNRKAQRTKVLKGFSQTVERVWLLSGAPTSRFYDDMWSQLNILLPRRFTSYWRFAERYCHVEKGDWGWSIVANRPDSAQMLIGDLADVYFARTQDEVLDLPDWIIEPVYVPLSPEQYKPYAQMEAKFKADLGEDDFILAANVLAQLTRLIQLASNPVLVGGRDLGAKWDAVEEILQYESFPVIIWTSFIETANRMSERLTDKGLTVGVLTGETKDDKRQEIVDQFQGGELDIIIAHPGVGKFGLTLTRARTAIYLERSYNGDDYYQSLHRIRRIGTEHSPHVLHLIATDPDGSVATVDGVIDRILAYRRDSSIALTSGMLLEAWND